MTDSVDDVDIDVDVLVPEATAGHRTGVSVDDDEITVRQQHQASIGDYWNRVSVCRGELETLMPGFDGDGEFPDELRGGSWKTNASVRPDGNRVTLVQSSAGAGGRNGDSVYLDKTTLVAILDWVAEQA